MQSFVDLMHLVANNVWLYGVSFLVILSILVFVHEWGHYIVARMCGVRVDEFSIGFGKELFGWTDKKGTRWKFSLIPLGGFVKMYGDVDPASAQHKTTIEDSQGHVRPLDAAERSVAFFAKSPMQRVAIVFAGPAINFIFAIMVLAILFMTVGKPVTPPNASAVEIGGAADLAGFKPHDDIVSIDGQKITGFDDVRLKVMLALDTPMQFNIVRDGKPMTLTATPKRVEESDRFGFNHEKGYLGLIGPANGLDITKILSIDGTDVAGNPEKARSLLLGKLGHTMKITLDRGTEQDKASLLIAPPAALNRQLTDAKSKEYNALVLGVRPGDELLKFNPLTAIAESVKQTFDITTDTLKAIWQMVTGIRSPAELGGIIRIGAMAGDMAERGFIALATFTALLSINLGLINLFPIPMLDGGHLLFYGIEMIKGKPLSERVQEYAFRFGLVVLVALMVFANLNDILHLIPKFNS